MKKLSTYLFLILFSLSAPSFADDIRDFQIEGMSIGDSLLDYFTEEEIQKNILTGYKDNTFAGSSFIPKVDGLYEAIQVHFKTDDEKYIIFSLDGMIAQEQIKKCIKQRNKIVDEMSKLFKSSKKKVRDNWDMVSGHGKLHSVTFNFNSGDYTEVVCYDYNDKHRDEAGAFNHMRVGIVREELNEWIVNLAYK